MSLTERIMQDLKQAMRDKDQTALDTLRAIKSAMGYKKVELMRDLEEAEELQILQKEAAKRRDAAAEFERGGRADLVERECAQLKIVERYLPEAMSQADVETVVRAAIAETGAAGKKDMGKVMQHIMPQLRGKADGKLVNQIVASLLE
jgi:uncharacterized protein